MNRGFRGGDAAEPVAVLQAAIQQLAQRDQQAHEPAPAERAPPAAQVPLFLPADYFQGARQGYYFGTGDQGTGYVTRRLLWSLGSCVPLPLMGWAGRSACPQPGAVHPHDLARPCMVPVAPGETILLHAACCAGVHSYYRDEQQELEPDAAAARPHLDPEELLRQAEQQAEAAEVGGVVLGSF